MLPLVAAEGKPLFEVVATHGAFLGLLVVGVYTMSGERWHLRLGVVLAGLTCLVGVVSALSRSEASVLAVLGATLAFSGFLTVGLVGHVMRRQHRVTADVLYSAVTVFILAAVDWAFLYVIVQILWPGALVGAIQPPDSQSLHFSDCLYFSTCVLTTVGLGDITAAPGPARLLVSLESLFGVMYPAVILARLVGLYTQGEEESQYPDADP